MEENNHRKGNKKFLFVFLGLIALSFFLRFWQLDKLPPTLTTDEVALGYNAYSILKTGKDEYGRKLPISLRSFDDYKPPLYSYAVIPSIALWGKNDFAIRFPSAIAGFLTTFCIFLLVWELTKNKWLSLTAFFLLSTSPWHFQYSRTAYEVNLSLFLTVLGFWTFLKARKRGIFLLFSAVCFGLSIYSYQGSRLLSPLFIALLISLFWRDFLDKKRWVVGSLMAAALFIIPLVGILQGVEGQLRPLSVSIFSETQPKEIFRERLQRDFLSGVPFENLWHNYRFVYLTPFLKSYLSQFRPDFLFMGNPLHHAPDVGLLYLWQIPFIFLGLHFLISKERPRIAILLIFWSIIAPLASASAKDIMSYRLLPLIVPLEIITAYGLFLSFKHLRRLHSLLGSASILVISSILTLSFVYYLHMYFNHLKFELPYHFEYGRAEAARETKKMGKDYQKIIVSTGLEEVYIYYLFYTDYDPATYIKEGGTVSGGWNEMGNHFGNYEFHTFDSCLKPNQYEKTLLVWPTGENQACAKILKTISSPNGKPAIHIGIAEEKKGN